MKKTMHTFGRVKQPKNKKTPIHDIPGFTYRLLKKYMGTNSILKCGDDYYQYKGNQEFTWNEPNGDFIRVKDNNDIVADILIVN